MVCGGEGGAERGQNVGEWWEADETRRETVDVLLEGVAPREIVALVVAGQDHVLELRDVGARGALGRAGLAIHAEVQRLVQALARELAGDHDPAALVLTGREVAAEDNLLGTDRQVRPVPFTHLTLPTN